MMEMDRIAGLRDFLKDHDKIVLAFSGGLDSTFLAQILKEEKKDFCAVTVDNGLLLDLQCLKEEVKTLGICHDIVEMDVTDERNFAENTTERCYFCKKMIIGRLKEYMNEKGYTCIMDASNTSDLKDYRAGMVALKEEGILSPLLDSDIGKEEIIEYSKKVGLEVKPPESCMATRIPPYTSIKRDDIARIRELENGVRDLGFATLRARTHGTLVRFQFMSSEMEKAMSKRADIERIARAAGFEFATVDLVPYPFEHEDKLMGK
jgi:uncharacterized protein